MNEIKIAVNLYVFALAVLIWVMLGGLTAIPGYDMPEPLSFLFATLTGVILTIVQGFKEGVTFNSTTETVISTKTSSIETKGAENEKADSVAADPTLPTA
jgi:hypothetical protein